MLEIQQKNMKFKSKAHTLSSLKLKNSIIPELHIYNCNNYKKNKNKVINTIASKFLDSRVAIRSSFENEDTDKSSNAGKYISFLNINSFDVKKLEIKIDRLIKSKKVINKNEHFFVQKMVKDIRFSGVALTRNLEDYSKCININYYDGNNTEAVTSGKFKTKSIIYIENEKFLIPSKFKKLYLSIIEIIEYTKYEDLDIEFAVGKNDKVYILQVRKLVIPQKNKKYLENQNVHLEKLGKKINKLKEKHHDLLGNTTFFGNMPDWNPAEIIGTKPRPLALSLYQELITDHIWSKNRFDYGYRDLSQFHLMTTFFGTPYVDIRIDFNSWIPKNLDKKISKKIVNFYLRKFNLNEDLQDKIEFKIIFSCITFSSLERIKKDLKNTLNQREIKIFYNSLKNINLKALSKKNVDIKLIGELEIKQKLIRDSNLYEIDKIYWLVEDCKKFGTLPFAGLARCGFIAIELLNSMVEKKIISEQDKKQFLNNINTITSVMKKDLQKLSRTNFVKKYGHLRPGTYDINSLNYKEGFNNYFNKPNFEKNVINKSPKIANKIKKPLKKLGIYNSTYELLKFIKESIAYREYSKFVFSKSIDCIFENLIKFGKKYNISREDLSYIKISEVLDMYFNLSNHETINNIKKNINENKKEYLSNKNISLPDTIKSPRDLYIKIQRFDKINYISDKKVISKVINYKTNNKKADYNGIVCIENADPGYDFLFSKNIKGLITKYGGLNSHMAIRCSELSLPALIGVGEKNFNKIIKYKSINIDCVTKKIELIN